MTFNDISIIERSIARFYATKSPNVEVVHCLIDAHFPMDYPNHRKRLEALALKYGCVLLDPGKNLGLSGNFNWAWKQFQIPGNAGVIGYDPDCWAVESCWDEAMCDVIVEPGMGWVMLHNQGIVNENDPAKPTWRRKIGGHNCLVPGRAIMNSICMWKQEWLVKMAGITEGGGLYGGLESIMYPKLRASGYEMAILEDFYETHYLHWQAPEPYKYWKQQYAHTGQIKVDFETWINQGSPRNPKYG